MSWHQTFVSNALSLACLIPLSSMHRHTQMTSSLSASVACRLATDWCATLFHYAASWSSRQCHFDFHHSRFTVVLRGSERSGYKSHHERMLTEMFNSASILTSCRWNDLDLVIEANRRPGKNIIAPFIAKRLWGAGKSALSNQRKRGDIAQTAPLCSFHWFYLHLLEWQKRLKRD